MTRIIQNHFSHWHHASNIYDKWRMLPITLLSYHFQTSRSAGFSNHPWAVAASRWDRPTSSWWGSRSYETNNVGFMGGLKSGPGLLEIIQRKDLGETMEVEFRPLLKQHSEIEINIQKNPFGIGSLSTQCHQVRCKSIFEVEKFKLSSKMASMQTSIPQHTLPLFPPSSLRRLAKALLAIPTSLVGSKSASLNLLLSLAPRPRIEPQDVEVQFFCWNKFLKTLWVHWKNDRYLEG